MWNASVDLVKLKVIYLSLVRISLLKKGDSGEELKLHQLMEVEKKSLEKNQAQLGNQFSSGPMERNGKSCSINDVNGFENDECLSIIVYCLKLLFFPVIVVIKLKYYLLQFKK